MAVRKPLYVTAGGNLQEMTSAMINEIIAQTCYQYSLNPSVTLSVVSSGGSVGTITDTRMKAGGYSTRAGDGTATDGGDAEYPPESTTAEPIQVNVNYSKINETVATVSEFSGFGAKSLPLFWNGTGLQVMTNDDVYNTFIEPAIDILVSSSVTSAQGGTYQIHTTNSLAGNTLVDAATVFNDTRFNTAATPTTIDTDAANDDIPTTISSFYLHRLNGAEASYTRPVGYTTGSNLQTHTKGEFDTALQTFVRYAAANRTNYKIRYTYTTGNNRGSGMTDTRLDGAGNWVKYKAGDDDYRAQEFPNGTAQTINTYYLKIGKIA